MKTIFKNFLLAAVFFSAASCSEDFLDRQPLDRVVSSNFYKTESDAIQALVAVYDVLGYESSPGISWAPYLTVSDILSDDSYAGGADANDGFNEDELNNFNIPTTNVLVHSIWIYNYNGIYRANLLLDKIEGIEASDEFKNQIIAECKFLRAYFHFQLVRLFENIPVLTATLGGPSEYQQDQESPEETYNQIAKDLVESMAGLPEVLPPAEKGRATKWAAEALLGRVYLFYNGVYGQDLQAGDITINNAQVLEYLEDVINNSGHDLMPSYDSIFTQSGEFSEESVFEISHGESPAWWDWNYVRGGEGNLAAQMQGPRLTNSQNYDRGWAFAPVSQKLVNDLAGDPRYDATILEESELSDGDLFISYQFTGYFSEKYTSDAEHWSSDGQFELNRTCNNRVIRFADVLLMAAELGSGNAQGYLDRVRTRVGLASVPATRENILAERRLELSLEGIRYFDVLRQGPSVASQELTVDIVGPNYVGDAQIFASTFNSATRGFLPIPQIEIDLSNGTLEQNEGY